MRQGDSDYVEKPLKAGTYNVTVARKGDNTYAKFEQTYDAVMTINKADRTIEADGEVADAGYTYLEVKGKIDDLDPNAKIAYFGNSVKGGEDLSVVYENKKITFIGMTIVTNVPAYFKGILDGQNHKITGAVNNSNSSYIGLLGRVSGKGTIVSNLLVDDSYF